MMSPQIITTNSAPAASRTSRTLTTWFDGRAAHRRVGRERGLRLRHAHRVVAVAVVLQLLDLRAHLGVGGDLGGAVDLLRDLVDLVPQRVGVLVDEGRAWRACRTGRPRSSPVPPRPCRRRPSAWPAPPGTPSFFIRAVSSSISAWRVEGEVVDRDHAGNAVDLAHVLDVALEVHQALFQRGEVLLADFLHVHAAVVLHARAPWRRSPRRSGRRPVLRHLMSRNFSAPRSAPKPASVTT